MPEKYDCFFAEDDVLSVIVFGEKRGWIVFGFLPFLVLGQDQVPKSIYD